MFTDFVLNGVAQGPVGEVINGIRFDPGMLRPYVDNKGNRCVTINTGRMAYNDKTKRMEPVYQKAKISDLMARGIYSPVFNSTSLRKEEWIQFDNVVLRAARQRLRAWEDVARANSFGGFNGMARTTLEYEAMSDPGEAVVDMDGLTDARADSPLFKLRSIPLPITHSDFWFSARRLAVSRNSGTPLDTTMAEAAGRRVAEMVEKTLIGVETGLTYGTQSSGVTAHDGNSTVYGYTNYVNRLTKTNLTAPTAGGWTPATTLSNVLAMRDQLYAAKFYGPFMLYHSNDWDQYLDNDYYVSITSGAVAPQTTLRSRLKAIEGIQDVKRLDYLDSSTNPFTLIMVQMTPDVVRAIVGMDITTVQWESQGGMRVNFKVMCIMVPQIRSDYSGQCGVLHATTS